LLQCPGSLSHDLLAFGWTRRQLGAGHTKFNSNACAGAMTPVQFGLFMPAEWGDQRRRAHYDTDLNRVLDVAMGHFDSASIVDHLQFADTDVLEGFTNVALVHGRAASSPHVRHCCALHGIPQSLARSATLRRFAWSPGAILHLLGLESTS
jgi:hypothetical protein